MKESEIRKIVKGNGVRSLRLQFTDIAGITKSVTLPVEQLDKALAGEIMFDGSSIEGFVRIEESDMFLRPDPATFVLLPWEVDGVRAARMICGIYTPGGDPFDGCPRNVLQRVIDEAAEMGYTLNAGPEPEFFIFHRDQEGRATTLTHECAGYFDLAPVDLGERVRQDIINRLVQMGFEVEASHHEVAPGQHEIDFKYADALTTADMISTFKYVVRRSAADHSLHATFMPKPVYGVSGSGMHIHQSLIKAGHNAFFSTESRYQLTKTALYYIGGLLKHARALTAVTNPLVNSYKRLVPGYEAPVYISWSEHNRSPLIRVPAGKGKNARIEYRSPDPSCNPYLALAVILKAGLDGIKNRVIPPEPVQQNLFRLTEQERVEMNIKVLPENLKEAVEELKRDVVIREAMGSHIYHRYIEAKRIEWEMYRKQIHSWEHEQYLEVF